MLPSTRRQLGYHVLLQRRRPLVHPEISLLLSPSLSLRLPVFTLIPLCRHQKRRQLFDACAPLRTEKNKPRFKNVWPGLVWGITQAAGWVLNDLRTVSSLAHIWVKPHLWLAGARCQKPSCHIVVLNRKHQDVFFQQVADVYRNKQLWHDSPSLFTCRNIWRDLQYICFAKGMVYDESHFHSEYWEQLKLTCAPWIDYRYGIRSCDSIKV